MRATGHQASRGHRWECHPLRGSSCLLNRGGYASRTAGYHVPARISMRVYSSVAETFEASADPVVTIKMPYRVQFGEVIRVVGSSSLLGDWSADEALQLKWTEGDVWKAEVPITAGHYEFKCVVYNVETKSVTRWEDGENRILNITQEPGAWDVDCQWGATADMTQAFTPAPPPPSSVAPAPEDPVPQHAAAEESAEAAVVADLEEPVATFMALSSELQEAAEEAAPSPAEALPAVAAVLAAAESAAAEPAAASGGNGPIMLLLATAAAGAVAAFALLTPGGLDKATLGGRASQAVSTTMMQSSLAGAQVRAQVQSQLTALADHVSNVQAQVSAVTPAVQAQVSMVQGSVSDGLQRSVSYVQSQAAALQSKSAPSTST